MSNELLQDNLPGGDYVEAVRSSCRECVGKSEITINYDAIEIFLSSLDKQRYIELSNDSAMRFPLKFNSLEDEINIVSFVDLLNFGSGWRVPLHTATGRGAFDTIRFGALSFYIGGVPMTASHLSKISTFETASIFQIPIDNETVHPDMPFMRISESHELKTLAEMITRVLNETGKVLIDNGHDSLASFILANAKAEQPGAAPSAKAFVEKLVRTFPAFQDITKVNGQNVYIFKKAQLLAYHLHLLFSDQDPLHFGFSDIHTLTTFSDNVVPTMLSHLGILKFPVSLVEKIQSGLDVGAVEAAQLRAAAIVACEEIVRATKLQSYKGDVNMTEPELGTYLWRLGKDGDLRKIERFVLRDTVSF